MTIVGLDRLAECHAVRREVFIEGQDVPEELEVDGLDGECTHVLAEADGEVVGTARLRPVQGAGKVERVAVRAAWRGTGLGVALMHALHDEALRQGITTLKLNAQSYVVPFYEQLGYEAYGPEFMEAGIPHRAMKRTLS